MLHKDSQRRAIREGHLVAYNMSGQVVPGEVLDVSGQVIKVIYKGRDFPGNPIKADAHVSKVRDGSSMLILTPPDQPTPFHWSA